jgi:SAM-dependent methyltransferase
MGLGVQFARVSRLFVYLAAGTAPLARLRDDLRLVWHDFNPAVGEGVGLFPVEIEVFARHVPPASRVLLAGAGSGRELIALAEQGHQMSGLEPAPETVAICEKALRERGLTATLIESFVEEVDAAGPFDAIIFSYYCYIFIPMSSRRVETLRKAAALLAPGGRILISYEAKGRPGTFVTRAGRLAGAIASSDWRIEEGDTLMLRLQGVPRPCFFFEHVFTQREIEEEVAAAGLNIVQHRTAKDYPWIICGAP